jgi:hypothetical protein
MRSVIRGHPPIYTSPRPSAIGNLHAAVLSTTGFTVAVGLGVALGVGAAAGLAIATPLFQMNFLPDLTQVNLVEAVEDVAPAFVQGAPAFTAACEMGVRLRSEQAIRTTMARFRI